MFTYCEGVFPYVRHIYISMPIIGDMKENILGCPQTFENYDSFVFSLYVFMYVYFALYR